MEVYIQRFDAAGNKLPLWGPYGSQKKAETHWEKVQEEFPGVTIEYKSKEQLDAES